MPRISVTTLGAEAGLTEEQLRAMGNWVSNKSMEGYIRLKGKKLNGLQEAIAKHLEVRSAGSM